MNATTRLTASPPRATTITVGPATGTGASSRCDRLDGDPDDEREHRERIDERGEHFGARIAVGRALATAGARVTAAAISATTNDAASVTMWPASEISASEPAKTPASASTTAKPPVRTSATHSARRVACDCARDAW